MSAARSRNCGAAWKWSRRMDRSSCASTAPPASPRSGSAPRLARFLREHPGIEVRLAAGTDYTRFLNDEFDADILYGLPRQEGFVVVPLGEETVAPLCTSDLARAIRTPMDLFRQVLIESETKQVRWPDWFARNGLPAPRPQGVRFDRSFLAIAAAGEGLGVALESTRLAERELASGRLVRPWPAWPKMSVTSGTTWCSRGARASARACVSSPNG